MEPRCIELKLISCKDLKAFNFFQKLTVYALVSIASNDPKRELSEEQKQQQRTQTDRDSDNDGDGSNPEWNHEARFDLGWLSQPRDSDDLFFRFEFRHDAVILGDKLIGECRVPLADLIRDAGFVDGVARFVSYEVRSGDGVARFVSYEVRSGDGKPNGIFNFSYRLKGIGTHSSQILVSGYPLLAPEDCAPNQSHVQYPTVEFENPSCCYPTVALPVGSFQEGFLYPPPAVAPPPPVSSPSSGEYNYYYPPLPPPPPYPYPPPPPPVSQSYPPFGPEAHPWPSGPYCEHRW
ncbi:protein SRC2-like [Gastrolobium bilobum]|uniref:protein SRC2-like n=1 Tax=Gastrolobium bilobum TaxID=150636 RepID=UPI002AB0EE29|nr:protein SRC2-like [Gastrolobium bilobum]